MTTHCSRQATCGRVQAWMNVASQTRQKVQTSSSARGTPHADAVGGNSLFATKKASVAATRFEIRGDDGDPEIREQRALRQRTVNEVISRLLGELGDGGWNGSTSGGLTGS